MSMSSIHTFDGGVIPDSESSGGSSGNANIKNLIMRDFELNLEGETVSSKILCDYDSPQESTPYYAPVSIEDMAQWTKDGFNMQVRIEAQPSIAANFGFLARVSIAQGSTEDEVTNAKVLTYERLDDHRIKFNILNFDKVTDEVTSIPYLKLSGMDEFTLDKSVTATIEDILNKIPDSASSSNKLVTDQQLENATAGLESGYTPKGPASVSTLNNLTTQENGDQYIVTDSGTLTDGSLAVTAGESVAWDSTNEVWYKVNQYALRRFGTNEVHSLPQNASESDFTSSNYIPVDTPEGTKKLPGDAIAPRSALDNAVQSIAPEFDPTRTEDNPYKIHELVMYAGILKECVEPHYGAWESDHFITRSVNEIFANVKLAEENIGDFSLGKNNVVDIDGVQHNIDLFNASTPIPKDERNWWHPKLGKIIDAYIYNNSIVYSPVNTKTIVFKMPKNKSFLLGQGAYNRLGVLVTDSFPIDGKTGQEFKDVVTKDGRNYINFHTNRGEYVSVFFYNSLFDNPATENDRLSTLSCSSLELGYIDYVSPGKFGILLNTSYINSDKIADVFRNTSNQINDIKDDIYSKTVGTSITPLEQYSGKYISQLGNYNEAQGFTATRFPAFPFMFISGRSAGASGQCLAVVFDTFGNILETIENATGKNYSDLLVKLPANASSIVVNCVSNFSGAKTAVLSYNGSEVSSDISAINQVIFMDTPGDEIAEDETYAGKALLISGELQDNSGFAVREYDVEGIDKIYVSGRSPGNMSYCLAVAKDSGGNVVSKYEVGTGTDYNDYLLTLPDSAVTLLVNASNSGSHTVKECVTEKSFYTKTEAQALFGGNQSYWKGKKIWWCGTSIPAGGYPQIVGTNLGAEVTNKAVGGSMCRANVRTGDYVGANFENITSCLTMTKAEIENFIANYSTIQPTLTGNAPATLSASYISRLRSASFEDRLIPYLDGTYDFPDLFVIDHGHNDFKYTMPDDTTSDITLEPTVSNISQGILAEDTYMTANDNEKLVSFLGSLDNIKPADKPAFIASLNRNCYKGSINFLVTLILKYNPFARIVFISNYEHENGDYPRYAPLITAQQDNANSWAFPLCEVFRKLGYSNHIIPGTKNIYSGSYSFDYDIDAFKVYCPDKVHPHSQPDGISNAIYAGILAEFLKTCR